MTLIYRKDKIVELCSKKTVLHLGFIQHSHLYKELIKKGNWLHQKINKVARKLVGIDFLQTEVSYIQNKYDYEVYYADVTSLEKWEYNEKFDVIVCGELIEHLQNPGLMLNGIKRLMSKDTILIITTPNPWSRNRLKLIKKEKKETEWLNPEHTCWFSFQTLKQLLERSGFSEVNYSYFYGETAGEGISTNNILLKPYMKFKRQYLKRNTPEINYNGLFFQAMLK